nr:immunoglobulin heavy chain junction region [Mus musculus]
CARSDYDYDFSYW